MAEMTAGRWSGRAGPRRLAALALSLLAGMVMTGALSSFLGSAGDGPGSGVGGLITLFGALIIVLAGVMVSSRFGSGLGALLWRRHWRRTAPPHAILLTADRTPPLALAGTEGVISIHDLQTVHDIARKDGLGLQPYEIVPGEGQLASGLLVRDSDSVVAHLPGRFDQRELRAFADAVGVTQLPTLDRAEEVPRPPVATTHTEQSPEIGVIIAVPRSAYRWGSVAGVLTVVSPLLAAFALCVFAGLLPLPPALALAATSLVLYAGAGWALLITNTPVWLRRPELIGSGGLL